MVEGKTYPDLLSLTELIICHVSFRLFFIGGAIPVQFSRIGFAGPVLKPELQTRERFDDIYSRPGVRACRQGTEVAGSSHRYVFLSVLLRINASFSVLADTHLEL